PEPSFPFYTPLALTTKSTSEPNHSSRVGTTSPGEAQTNQHHHIKQKIIPIVRRTRIQSTLERCNHTQPPGRSPVQSW
ncbi:hypothetical protein H4Q26_003954, partial [Puccinia striiformis f. sp. tritici PST-130]